MIRTLTTLLMTTAMAQADMVDYGFQFASAAQAIADATMLAGQYSGVNATWMADHVLAGITCWRPSLDVAGVHTPLAGYYVIVSVDTVAAIPALLNHAKLAFAFNRTSRISGQPFVIKNNIGAIISDLGCQPLFAMNNPYPIGGFQ